MPIKDQEGLLTMMERGEFTNTKVRNTQTVKAKMVIFATSNSTERLSKPLLSRFTVFEIPEYTYEEFEAISVRIIKKKIPQNVIVQIASSVWKSGSKDVRDCIKISKLATAKDTEEDIRRLISIIRNIARRIENTIDSYHYQEMQDFQHENSEINENVHKSAFVIVISGIMVAFSAAFIPMERNDDGAIISPHDPYSDLFDR